MSTSGVPFCAVALSLCIILTIIVSSNLNDYLRYPDQKLNAIEKQLNPFLTFPESPIEHVDSRGGRAVRESCRYPMEVLFFVHTAPRHWTHRAVYRDTLVQSNVSAFFNWTMVFFVGSAGNDTLTSVWNQLEADASGDMVILPFLDTYRNLSAKFLGGMRWVAEHCPKVRYIVKLDDDMFVHPFRLTEYMRTNLQPNSRDLHCHIWFDTTVHRVTESPWFVPHDLFHEDLYYTYCSGMSVIMTADVLRDLCRWSPLIPAYSVDDAYVTGDLALLAGVGHVDMSQRGTWYSQEMYSILDQRKIFVHVDEKSITSSKAFWHLILWHEISSNTNLSSSLQTGDVLWSERETFERIRGYLKKGPAPEELHPTRLRKMERSRVPPK